MRRYLIIDDRSDDPERLRKILLEEGYGVSESPGWPGFLTGEAGSRTPFPLHPAAGRENPDQVDRTLPPDSSGHADAGNSPGRTEGWPGRYLPEAALLMRAEDSVILEVNGAFEQLSGYGRQEIVGQSALGLFFFLNPERWSQAFRTLQATGEVRELETRIVRKDRQVAFVLMSLQSTGAAGINCHQATIHDITGVKTGEKSALLEQGLPEPGLESLLSPGMDINREKIGQLIDFEALQDLMNSFYKTTKIGIGINDVKGNVQVATGWQDICTCFHRVHPETLTHCIESDIHLSQSIGEGKYSLYKCRNNLWDIATPLIIGGRHIANIFLGQFFFDDEVPDYDLFRKQAELYGFNADEYLAALERVPR